ncbi:MAG: GNAT family N-acetyltransferase [Antricoccus sp.]
MADAHVREARPQDADEIGRILVDTWRQAYAKILPTSALQQLDQAEAAQAWRLAITNPPGPGHQVFTAYERSTTGEQIVGFLAIAPPAEDEKAINAPTAEVATVLVEPRWARRGHGSRLLSAAVAIAAAGKADQLICWLPMKDKASAAFLQSAGWDRDGWTRTLDAGGTDLIQQRFATDISQSATDPAGRTELPVVN